MGSYSFRIANSVFAEFAALLLLSYPHNKNEQTSHQLPCSRLVNMTSININPIEVVGVEEM